MPAGFSSPIRRLNPGLKPYPSPASGHACCCAAQTSGVDVVVAQVPVPDTTVMVELYLFDTSGSDLYKEYIQQYWNGIYYAALVYDVTSQESFEACKAWFDELKKAR